MRRYWLNGIGNKLRVASCHLHLCTHQNRKRYSESSRENAINLPWKLWIDKGRSLLHASLSKLRWSLWGPMMTIKKRRSRILLSKTNMYSSEEHPEPSSYKKKSLFWGWWFPSIKFVLQFPFSPFVNNNSHFFLNFQSIYRKIKKYVFIGMFLFHIRFNHLISIIFLLL